MAMKTSGQQSARAAAFRRPFGRRVASACRTPRSGQLTIKCAANRIADSPNENKKNYRVSTPHPELSLHVIIAPHVANEEHLINH